MPPPCPRTRLAIEKAKKMPRHRVERHAFGKARLGIGNESFDRCRRTSSSRRLAKESPVHLKKQSGVLIGGPANHHTIDILELGAHLRERCKTAIEHDRDIGIELLQAMDELVIERRHIAILLWREAFKPGFARVDDQSAAASGDHAPGQSPKRRRGVWFVDARAALDRDGNFHPRLHRGNTIADELWLTHKASAEGPAFHAF